MNAIPEFYLSVNDEEYYPRAIENFTVSAEQAGKCDVTSEFYLEALVVLADVSAELANTRNQFVISSNVTARKVCVSYNSKSLLSEKEFATFEAPETMQHQHVRKSQAKIVTLAHILFLF